MKRLQPVEEILSSWRRCMASGVVHSAMSMNAYIKEAALQMVLNESKALVSLFEDMEKELKGLTASNNLILLLTNAEGILLKKTVVKSYVGRLKN